MTGARLTQGELRAINAALAEKLAGEMEPASGTTPDDYETAKQKIEDRIRWRPDE